MKVSDHLLKRVETNKKRIGELFYIPVSIGMDYPISKKSYFESEQFGSHTTDNIKSRSIYMRIGIGYDL